MKQATAQHTPGSWYRMDKRYSNMERICIEIATFSDDGNPQQHIARVNHCDINPTKEVSETVAANARLIAASPALLDALRLGLLLIERIEPNDTLDEHEQAFANAARAAIQQATA